LWEHHSPQVVCKPSEFTPQTASLLASVVQEVGLPAGVFNLVHGLGADVGSPLYAESVAKVTRILI
jgi:acyl-CoA reductase-like NAD-dependent aldehyde dehydrogenase